MQLAECTMAAAGESAGECTLAAAREYTLAKAREYTLTAGISLTRGLHT